MPKVKDQSKPTHPPLAQKKRLDSNFPPALDLKLIEAKQKDPHEWKRFLDKGRALQKLFNKLIKVKNS